MVTRKEENILFNDALNIILFMVIWRQTYGKENKLLPLHGLQFPISSKCSFIVQHHPEWIAHTLAFVTPVMEHWLEREMGPP